MKKAALPLPQIEQDVLAFWNRERIFEETVNARQDGDPFVFYDGPPFTTGLPHYGHIMQMAIKDAVLRYKTMQGFNVPRKIGWDTHGLPVEFVLEKELNLKNKRDIEAYGIDKFVEAARGIVLRCVGDWKQTMERMGRWVDVSNPYATMDNRYIESVWWAFNKLNEKNLIYKDFRVSPYCPRCGTVLSNFELNQGYKDDTQDPSVYVSVKVTQANSEALRNTRLVLWTTTPWTLPANVALAVDPQASYVVVNYNDIKYVVAKDRARDIFTEGFVDHETIKGEELIGLTYEPLFNLSENEGAYRVVAGHHVTTDNGTGIVHMAPAYGEDDYVIGRNEGLITPLLQSVNEDGSIKTGMNIPGEGKFFKQADKDIIADLTERGLMLKEETMKHTYPFCWRCDTPLLYYPVTSWFVKVTDVRDKLVSENAKIKWQPSHLRDGRFGKWLEGARDWAISRNRYWGAPLPVWECDGCDHVKFVTSRQELGVADDFDLHRPYIDAITMKCDKDECQGTMKRVPFVFDCWFESGSMPYAQHHYPFHPEAPFNPELGKGYPADFIAEALDQTRGWFYTMHVLGVALFGEQAYKNVVVSGLLLASDGRKLSKKLRNYTDPQIIMDEQGVDALRLFLFTATTIGEDYRFSDTAVADVKRRWIAPFLNVVDYYQLSLDDRDASVETLPEHELLDKWMHARTDQAEQELFEAMEGKGENSPYDLVRACRTFGPLIEDLSTWYVRLSRGRKDLAFSENLRDRLLQICRMYAPYLPFVTEHVFQILREEGEAQSVHMEYRMTELHEVSDSALALLQDMDLVRDIVKKGRDWRVQFKLPLKQPLLSVTIETNKDLPQSFYSLIAQELQAKEVIMKQSDTDMLDVTFDETITPELEAEGRANELRRSVQALRKEADLAPSDVASVYISNVTDSLRDAIVAELGQQTVLLDMQPSDATSLGEAQVGDHDIILFRM